VNDDERACWDLNNLTRTWNFCASAANGNGRCKKGTCRMVEPAVEQMELPVGP
jgi:hypothetical protein